MLLHNCCNSTDASRNFVRNLLLDHSKTFYLIINLFPKNCLKWEPQHSCFVGLRRSWLPGNSRPRLAGHSLAGSSCAEVLLRVPVGCHFIHCTHKWSWVRVPVFKICWWYEHHTYQQRSHFNYITKWRWHSSYMVQSKWHDHQCNTQSNILRATAFIGALRSSWYHLK